MKAPAVPRRVPAGRSPVRLAWRALAHDRPALAGLAVVAGFTVLALVGLWLTRGPAPLLDPREVRLPDRLLPPLSAPRAAPGPGAPRLSVYVLGTDELGRDVLARMLEGAVVSLSVGLVAVGLAVAIGCVLGGIAGHYGRARVPVSGGVVLAGGIALLAASGAARARGAEAADVALWVGLGALLAGTGLALSLRRRPVALTVDAVITGLVDVMLCFPTFFLVLTVVAVVRPSIWNIMAVIGLTSWEGPARFVRAEILSLREQEFVLAAAAVGASGPRTIARHLLPNALAPVLVSATLGVAGAILTESALSFLGFGVPPPEATWGNVLADGRRYLFDAPWLTLVPGTAIFLLVLALNLFGEGLREAFNPRLHATGPRGAPG